MKYDLSRARVENARGNPANSPLLATHASLCFDVGDGLHTRPTTKVRTTVINVRRAHQGECSCRERTKSTDARFPSGEKTSCAEETRVHTRERIYIYIPKEEEEPRARIKEKAAERKRERENERCSADFEMQSGSFDLCASAVQLNLS